MIDLPVFDDDSEIDLHPKILLYNNLLTIFSLILLLGSLMTSIAILSNTLDLGAINRFAAVLLLVIALLQSIDIYAWYLIRSGKERNIDRAASIYLIPVIVDIALVFAFGLGILPIFLRIVVYGSLNQDELYYDEDDPLFTS